MAASSAGSVARSVAGATPIVMLVYEAWRLRSTRSRARFVPWSRAVVRLVLARPPSIIVNVPSTPTSRTNIAIITSMTVKPA